MGIQKVIPKALRNRLHQMMPGLYEKLRYHYYLRFRRNAGYDTDYYAGLEASNFAAYQLFAKALTTIIQPQIVVDIGCGSGGIGKALLEQGVKEVHGFDYSSDSVAIARTKLTSARQLDITKATEIPARGDLCTCTEVAEHIPERFSAHLAQMLASVAPIIAFTAAPPGQGGHLHINLHERAYWIAHFKNAGMSHDETTESKLRASFEGKMIKDYDQNLMVFRRNSHE